MKDELAVKCKLYVQNRDILKSEFKWASSNMLPLCAYMYAEKGRKVDAVRIEECRQIIMKHIGVFSKVKGQEIFPLATLLSLDTNAEKAFEKRIAVYQLLKKEFETTVYLPEIAFALATFSQIHSVNYEKVISQAKRLEEQIQSEFEGNAIAEYSGISVLLSLSGKSQEKLLGDLKMAYELFRNFETEESAIPMLCYVVAAEPGETVDACEKVMSAYGILMKNRIMLKKIGEITTLGLVAASQQKVETYIKDSIEINQYLKQQKGFDLLNVSSAERHMFSFMLAADGNDMFIEKQMALVAAVYSTMLVAVLD
ncbi:MAG: DUF4003 family protein [bacterium]|nr:DUF4003 family protein [bacterium]